MFKKMAFPTPGLSEAPTIAIEVGERKISFIFSVLNKKFYGGWL